MAYSKPSTNAFTEALMVLVLTETVDQVFFDLVDANVVKTHVVDFDSGIHFFP